MKNVHISYIRVTEGKIQNLKKEGKMRISTLIFFYTIHFAYLKVYTKFHNPRDQARGQLGRNSRPRGRNFALNGTQGEVGVSLKKKKKKKNFFFF